MILQLSISDLVLRALRQKADASGQEVAEYATSVLGRLVGPPTSIREISGPLTEEFEASGLSENQLVELLEDAKHRTRQGGNPS